MAEGKQLIVSGDLTEKRSWDVEDGKMHCLTIVGRGFTHEQYVTKDVYNDAPDEGEKVTVFGPPKVNRKGDVTIGMKDCQIQLVAAAAGRRGRAAAA